MTDGARARLQELQHLTKERFSHERRVLSFGEYLELVLAEPRTYLRDASRYVYDMLAHFGTREVATAAGSRTRYRLFDQEFLSEEERPLGALVGQDDVVLEFARALSNFVRVGQPSRVVLFYGPNGSAKSTTAACILRGLEEYSRTGDGAVYKFSWVFPKKNAVRGGIGFGGERVDSSGTGSYARLRDDELEARIEVEVRDHPLFLLPREQRRALLVELFGPDAVIPRYLLSGSLCDKSQKIFSALLSSYSGSIEEVFRHVRVERVFFSKRYRLGAVTLGPEVSVDARERQITMDQNLGALPISLHGLSLYEVSGELVEASGGVLELSDLLKRPLDAFRYLELTAETGEVALNSQTLLVNSVLVASTNDVHLAAFRKHPEYPSFRGRLELIRVPYLLDFRLERELYERQIAKRSSAHVAPHATEVAARFAVITRLLAPDAARHEERDRPAVEALSAFHKHQLYAGELPELGSGLSAQRAAHLTERLQAEWAGSDTYEGGHGVSPRTMRTLLLDAAQDPDFGYLSPFAVLRRIGAQLTRRDDFIGPAPAPTSAGYGDFPRALEELGQWLLDRTEAAMSEASGLVGEGSYGELLTRYIEHVSAAAKGETLFDPTTGKSGPPDAGLFEAVETLLDAGRRSGAPSFRGVDARATLLGRIAAWSLDHPGVRVRDSTVYAELLEQVRRATFQERATKLAAFCHRLVDMDAPRSETERVEVESAFERLASLGYTRVSATHAAAQLLALRLASGARS